MLPFAKPDRSERLRDGYVLADGNTLLEVGRYTADVGRRLLETYGEHLRVMAPEPRFTTEEAIPRLRGVLLPGFVKAHGHDHEQPLIGVAKDEPLTAWLDHAVNPFTASSPCRKTR